MLDEELAAYKALAQAVLWAAIDDHQKMVKSTGSIEAAMLAEPALWIFDDNPRPLGYSWCCELLGIPAYRLRMMLNWPGVFAAKQEIMAQ